jgi:catechol 2,3-dioxygenase-like lactoylglutathione lyase family enzyme
MRLGPIVGATLIVRSLERSLDAYAGQLGLVAGSRGRLPRQRALDMGDAALADAACAQLRSAVDSEPCLTLIEAPDAVATVACARRGWMALALAVEDVDGLSCRLDAQAWQVLSRPMDAPGAHGMRVLQVAGVDGEVLCLVQVTGSSMPLPMAAARCPVDRLFAATLGARDAVAALGFYAGLGLVSSRRLDSSGLACRCDGDADARIGVGQLRGGHLIEFDELPALPAADATLRTGIRMLSVARSDVHGRQIAGRVDPSARILAGPEGEALELV